MLWLALHLPRLSLEAFCATLPPAEQARPVALLHEQRLHGVNRAAAERGLRPGMKRATALALAPELLLAEASPARDAAALAAVVHAALGFTPAVCTEGPQTVLLELQASLRLFGGLARLRQQLQRALAALNAPALQPAPRSGVHPALPPASPAAAQPVSGPALHPAPPQPAHHVQMAAAPTALGAALLAQWFPQAIEPDLVLGPHAREPAALQALLQQAPVWLLARGREHWESLQGMGLHTLADLRALPRSGTARRFGPALLGDLDRAFGIQPDPREWLTLPDAFDSRIELHQRAETTEQVLHGAALLLARLLTWARARGVRVAGFVLRMLHERQRQTVAEPTRLAVALAEPSLDAAHLQLLLRERLARVALAAPTLELQLHCSQVVQGQAASGELFPSAQAESEGLTRLLERLCARLGPEQVQRLQPVADHRPERASRCVPVQTSERKPASRAGPGTGPSPGPPPEHLPLHHPAWLLHEPQPLPERDAQPLLHGWPLQIVGGPERIETGWWDQAVPTARDYYIALAPDGSLVWLFRSRLPAAPGAPNWFMQGLYA